MFDSDYDDDECAVYDDLDSSPQPHRNDDGNGAMTRIQNHQSEVERRQFLNARERERQKAKAAEFRRLTSANESLKIQVEDLQSEVESLRQIAIEKAEEEKVKEEAAKAKDKLKATKSENRAVFCNYYLRSRSLYTSVGIYKVALTVWLLVDLLASLWSLHGSDCPNDALLVSSMLMAICVMVGLGISHDRDSFTKASCTRMAALVIVALLNFSWSHFTSTDARFSILAAKIVLALISMLSLVFDAVDDAYQLTKFLEKTTGLDIVLDAKDDDHTSTSTPSEAKETEVAAAPAEPRTVELTKTAYEEMGMVMRKANDSLIVHLLMPRGIVEKQGEIRIGDEILSVNGINMMGATIEFARDLMDKIDGPFKMEVKQSTNNARTRRPFYL